MAKCAAGSRLEIEGRAAHLDVHDAKLAKSALQVCVLAMTKQHGTVRHHALWYFDGATIHDPFLMHAVHDIQPVITGA